MYVEPTGSSHWWDKGAAARKGTLKVLRLLDRVLTPGRIAKLLPPLPPKLWRRMAKKFPQFYAQDRKKVQVKVPERDWLRFLSACDEFQVTSAEALGAFMLLLVKMVEQDKGIVIPEVHDGGEPESD